MTIVETNETKRGSGISGAPKYGVCQTYIYYKFANNALLTAFQKCQSTQTAYVGRRGGGAGAGGSAWPPEWVAAAAPPPSSAPSPPPPPLPQLHQRRGEQGLQAG